MVERLDEPVIVDKILKYDEFKNFYHNEWVTRKKRGAIIVWEIDPACPQYAIQGFSAGSNNLYIRLRYIPRTLNDAFLAAHEVGHVIKYFDKQYIEFDKAKTPIAQTYKDEELIEMGAKLGSMVDDPLIDSFLQDTYDFDPARFYIGVVIPDVNKSLNSYGDSPYEWHIFKEALFYSQFSLQCDAVKDVDSLRECYKLKEQYKISRPKGARIGEELYSMSKENGYDDLNKQRKLFSKIFNKYRIKGAKLGDILCIK
ncbi:MAG: hypothetical protein WA137_03835 [Methanothrix sp.]